MDRLTYCSKIENVATEPIGKPACTQEVPIYAGARWRTIEEFLMRRIVTLRDIDSRVVGYRPTIQQGRGKNRITHSEVFRVTDKISAAMAMAMAQEWRDNKEAELGISCGRATQKSAKSFLPGICLVVGSKPPYRSKWQWKREGHNQIIRYITAKSGYKTSYLGLVEAVCLSLGIAMPDSLDAPIPSPTQYARLLENSTSELPDRRGSKRD